jgi:hypothetical protein
VSFAWLSAQPLERARAWSWAAADRVAFVVESALVANGVFWALTFAILRFSWSATAREWGSFWTHYAKAPPAARHPVELVLIAVAIAMTAAAAAIRLPKSRATWSPWPRRGARPRKLVGARTS